MLARAEKLLEADCVAAPWPVPRSGQALGGCQSFLRRAGRHGVWCDSTIGGVNQKRRPRQQGVMTSTTRADRESAVITPPAAAGTTVGRCDHVTRRRPFRLVPELRPRVRCCGRALPPPFPAAPRAGYLSRCAAPLRPLPNGPA